MDTDSNPEHQSENNIIEHHRSNRKTAPMMDSSATSTVSNRLTGGKNSPKELEQVAEADGYDKSNGNVENKNDGMRIKYHGSDDNDKQDGNGDNDDDDEEDMLERLLPPKPDYRNNLDEDLDELLGIEMNTMNKSESSSTEADTASDEIAANAQKYNVPPPKVCCVRKYGNTIILNTAIHNKTKCGFIGPHYVGVFSTVCLLSFGSYYFTNKAFDEIGIKSGLIGCLFTLMAFHNLLRTVCVDPGIVKRENQIVRRLKNDEGEAGEKEYETVFLGEEEGWRYCGLCSIYQPPKAVHCPDCNACVDGYDHHCPWMGTCIGKRNMGSFVCFNLTWLAFLIYSSVWVLALGPLATKRAENTNENV
mmetsp:Transcript_12558/g.19013  ORF Transcript_12558/g.19013 Transcript_12558/m.19013 type:complete len:362 (-) Transcript_12558:501-1586(-)